MKAFTHNLTSKDIGEIGGYLKCLAGLLAHIEATTNYEPEKRYIDSLELLAKILATNKELDWLLTLAETELKEKDENVDHLFQEIFESFNF